MDFCPDSPSFRSRAALASFGVFIAALILYIPTGAPGLWWGDGPELASAAYCLGIPHEPGYPFYILTSHGLIRLFGGLLEPIRVMALYSAVMLAAAAALMVRLVAAVREAKTSSTIVIAAGVALMMAFARTTWEHATFAEVYPLTLLMATILIALSWRQPESIRRTAALAYALGLASTNHYSILDVYPLAGVRILQGIFRSPRRGRAFAIALASYVIPLTLYLYLLIRAQADPILNESNPSSFAGLLKFLSARRYADFAQHQIIGMGHNFSRWLEWWGLEWLPKSIGPTAAISIGAILIALASAGLVRLALRRPVFGFGLLCSIAATLAYSLFYSIPDIQGYFLVALPAALIGWLECADLVASRVRMPRAAAFVPAALALAAVCFNFRDVNLANDRTPQHFARAILGGITPGGVVIIGGDSFFTLLYEQIVHHRRPDVAIFPIDWFYAPWHHPYMAGKPPSPIHFDISRRTVANDLQFTRDMINGVILPAHRAHRRVYCVFSKLSTLEQFFTRRPVISLPISDPDRMNYVLAFPQMDEIEPNPKLTPLSKAEVNAAIDRRLGITRKK
ncbi:DUF2723 domain-containing protein [bacterium]|nr:DUF2723 domain-containing protein [bacterium]